MGQEYDRRFEGFRGEESRDHGGKINISGAFLLDHESDILNLVKHEGRLAEEKNPSHKIKSIAKANGGIVVETSEHNLALRIGKQLVHAYKGEHNYKFTKGEKFVEVDWKRD